LACAGRLVDRVRGMGESGQVAAHALMQAVAFLSGRTEREAGRGDRPDRRRAHGETHPPSP